jgi:hypothetical protein
MKVKNGVLFLTRKEQRAIETMLRHAEKDQRYYAGGSFGDGEELRDDKWNIDREGKTLARAKEGLELVRDILAYYK